MDFASQMEESISNSVRSSPDSILFMIGEMLLYDFKEEDIALIALLIFTIRVSIVF